MQRTIAAGLTALFLTGGTAGALSSNVVTDARERLAYINIWGAIIEGDAARFRSLILPLLRSGYAIASVAISSPGGDMIEAMEIGDQVRFLRARTRAPSARDAQSHRAKCFFAEMSQTGGMIERETAQDPAGDSCTCASACLHIWASGSVREGNIVGVHRFHTEYSRPVPEAKRRDDYAATQYVVTSYLLRRGVPKALIDRLFATDFDSIYYLSETEVALVRNGSDFTGYANLRCGSHGGFAKIAGKESCVRSLAAEQARHGARAFLNRIRSY
jgi:hypothetical protein